MIIFIGELRELEQEQEESLHYLLDFKDIISMKVNQVVLCLFL